MSEPRSASDLRLDDLRFLMVGPPGVGKSTLLATLPGRKMVYAFDPNVIASYQKLGIDVFPFLPDDDQLSTQVVTLSGKGRENAAPVREPLGWVKWEEHFHEWHERKKFEDYDVIGFDSVTAHCRLAMDRCLWLNGRGGQWPTEGDYGPPIVAMSNAWRSITSIQRCIYATAHLINRKRKGGSYEDQLYLYGPLRVIIPGLFTDTYRCIPDIDKNNNRQFFVKTAQDMNDQYLRCSIPNIGVEEDVTVKDWNNPTQYGLGAMLRKGGRL